MTVVPAFLLVATLSQGWREQFHLPERKMTKEWRFCPNPPWVTSQWDPKADAPFQPIQDQLNRYRDYLAGDRSIDWIQRCDVAYQEWFEDCQNPVKLFKACGYRGIAVEVMPERCTTKRYKEQGSNLNIGWEILRNPPRSYLFVRMGYRVNAGDGHKHILKDLAIQLLKRNPLDRSVARAAAGEVWDERPQDGKQLPGKGKPLEDLVLSTMEKIRTTKQWRPWDDDIIAWVYLARALRTRERKWLELAITYNEATIKNVPAGYDKTDLLNNRGRLIELRKDLPH